MDRPGRGSCPRRSQGLRERRGAGYEHGLETDARGRRPTSGCGGVKDGFQEEIGRLRPSPRRF